MLARRSLRDSGFHAWRLKQAALPLDRPLAEAELTAIAEEIQSMRKTEERELVRRLTVLPPHLLKWRYQPAGRGNSWRLSIANSRDESADLIADHPSLKSVLDEVMASGYRYARRKSAIETEMDEEAFPALCPWRFAQAMEEQFWPG